MQHNNQDLVNLELLFSTSYIAKSDVVQQVLHELKQVDCADVYVGGISGSRIYRIAINDLVNPIALKFRAPCERDRFMMTFERICQNQGHRIVKSY